MLPICRERRPTYACGIAHGGTCDRFAEACYRGGHVGRSCSLRCIHVRLGSVLDLWSSSSSRRDPNQRRVRSAYRIGACAVALRAGRRSSPIGRDACGSSQDQHGCANGRTPRPCTSAHPRGFAPSLLRHGIRLSRTERCLDRTGIAPRNAHSSSSPRPKFIQGMASACPKFRGVCVESHAEMPLKNLCRKPD